MASNAINGGMLVPEPAMAEMYPSGVLVDLLDPKPETILSGDIAHHSGMLCRYGGGVKRFYSVAEHASLVADLLAYQGWGQDVVLAGLLHDAAEAYVGDMISPLKFAMRTREATKYGLGFEEGAGQPGHIDNGAWFRKPPRELRGLFSELADGLDRVIGERFGVDPELFDDARVKTADMWALKIEAVELTQTKGANWRWPGELPEGGELPEAVSWAGGQAPADAALAWLVRLGRVLGTPDLGREYIPWP